MKKLIYLSALSLVFASCVKTKGKISMEYDKATAVYGSLDSVRALPLLISKQELVKPKSFFIGSNYILVGENNKGIHIFDNVNMQNPQKMSFIQIPFNSEFYVKDNFLYAESLYDVIKIDISDVYNPVLVGRAENVFMQPLVNDKGQELIGFEYIRSVDEFELNSPEAKEIKSQGKLHLDYLSNMIPESNIPTVITGSYGASKGTMNRMAVEYNHVYVISDKKLHIISNAGAFEKVNEVKLTEGTETVYVTNNRLYLGSVSEMTIYGVNNPSSPNKISSLSHTESCDPVLPLGEIAYYTLRSVENEGCNEMGENTLNVVNLKNENEPTVVETFELKSPYGMCFSNNLLFVGEGINGITIFDASKPKRIEKRIEHTNVIAFDVMISPFNPNILIATNENGLVQYQINWVTLSLTQVGQLIYH
jgi:hypothetical protein